MTVALLRPIATICTVAVVFAGAAYAQTLSPSSGDSRLVAQAPVDQTDPKMQALQAAIDSKDTTAIFNLLNQTPRDQRGPMAALLLSAAQNLVVSDKQFAASLAALAFASGGLTGAQQNIAIAVIRNAPGGLAIVANLLSNSPTGGFGFSNVTTLALVNLVVAENQNQTQASPN
jgi:hypothetical protein